MGKYASEVVKQCYAWLGLNEYDGSFKEIIDTYNTLVSAGLAPSFPRGFRMDYKTAWCSAFVSAVAIKLRYTDIIPPEVGCGQHIELFKKLGIWREADDFVPFPGCICLFDWEDDGRGDNQGYPNHIGYVTKVYSDGRFITVEGNYDNAVKERQMKVNGKYIRGYAVPKYDAEPATESESKTENTTAHSKEGAAVTINLYVLRYGSKGEQVKNLQRLLIAKGYDLQQYGADGDFGDETEKAVLMFQKDNGLEKDGIVGENTWSSLLGAG